MPLIGANISRRAVRGEAVEPLFKQAALTLGEYRGLRQHGAQGDCCHCRSGTLKLERVVLQSLAKDPTERFPDAESLERALAACACAGDLDPDRAAQWWQDTAAASALLGSPRESLASHR
jgi:hypothetical protein